MISNTNRIFRCIEEVELAKWDSDNDCFSDEIMTVIEDSLWKSTGKGYVCDGEVRLEKIGTVEWIEISWKTLERHFRECLKEEVDKI